MARTGYLIDQFLHSGTNHCTDDWGGSVERRVRFLVEVTRAEIDAFGPHRVGVRLSPGGTFNDMSDVDPIATFGCAAAALDQLPCAYLHVVENRVAGESATDLMRRHFRDALISCGSYDRAMATSCVGAARTAPPSASAPTRPRVTAGTQEPCEIPGNPSRSPPRGVGGPGRIAVSPLICGL